MKARDERALGELYDLLAPWALGVSFRILQDQDEAEEVVADVFVQVWARIDQHDSRRGPLVPWILSIARNRALDAVRRGRGGGRRRAGLEQPTTAELGARAPDPPPHEAAVHGWPLHR